MNSTPKFKTSTTEPAKTSTTKPTKTWTFVPGENSIEVMYKDRPKPLVHISPTNDHYERAKKALAEKSEYVMNSRDGGVVKFSAAVFRKTIHVEPGDLRALTIEWADSSVGSLAGFLEMFAKVARDAAK
jgi:hypothetical protein